MVDLGQAGYTRIDMNVRLDTGIGANIYRDAKISRDKLYRYTLTRIWDSTLPVIYWIMLNPSTADATVDDATIRRCIGFAKLQGAGGIVVVNMFAFRATMPAELWMAADPVGVENDKHIMAIPEDAMLIAAWGMQSHPLFRQRRREVMELLGDRPLWCLGVTANGEPRHPVRLGYATQLDILVA